MSKEKELVKTSGEEKMLLLLRSKEEGHITKKREKILAEIRERQRDLEKEIAERPSLFYKLFSKFSKDYFDITEEDLVASEKKGLQYLDRKISKKISLWHKVCFACQEFWYSVIIDPALKLEDITFKRLGFEGLGVGYIVISFLAAFIGAPITMVILTNGMSGIILLLTEIISLGIIGDHYKKLSLKECDQCHYLSLSKLLKKQLGSSYFPMKEIKNLS